ncbi:MAG: hypothetical protein ABWK05_08435 [Pyrobaculum sp.]
MIAARDLVIFAGLAALATAFIASLFPLYDGVSKVPACSDCAFKLTGPYVLVQKNDSAVLMLGSRVLAQYAWAYRVDGTAFRVGENASCSPMYLWIIDGAAYVSCTGEEPKIGRRLW